MVWLIIFSWRTFTAAVRNQYPYSGWRLSVFPACAIIVASVPIKVALGISLWASWWPGDNMTAYLIGALIGLTAKGADFGEAPYRKFLS